MNTKLYSSFKRCEKAQGSNIVPIELDTVSVHQPSGSMFWVNFDDVKFNPKNPGTIELKLSIILRDGTKRMVLIYRTSTEDMALICFNVNDISRISENIVPLSLFSSPKAAKRAMKNTIKELLSSDPDGKYRYTVKI